MVLECRSLGSQGRLPGEEEAGHSEGREPKGEAKEKAIAVVVPSATEPQGKAHGGEPAEEVAGAQGRAPAAGPYGTGA